MFVFLSKTLPLLVYPLGLSIIFLIVSLLLRRERLRRALVILAVLILLLGSNRWVSYALARSLEWRYLPMDPVPQADAIVVLGGGTESAQYPRPFVETNSAGDRVLYAARLYKAGNAPVILVSGGNITWLGGRSMTPAEEMADVLAFVGVPESAIWQQNRSQNTREDALFSTEMLKERGASRVLLVTSAMHMPRAMALFEHLDVDVIPAPVDYTITQAGWDNLMTLDWQSTPANLLPNTSSLGLTTNALKEYIGLLVYRLQGWL